MMKVGIAIIASALLVAAVWSNLGFAQTVTGNAEPEDIGKEIRDHAARSGAPGTPEYAAALRQAIAAAAASIRSESGEYDRNRTIDVSRQSADSSKTGPLQVDSDPRYSKWLETAANNPVASLKIAGCQAMDVRVVGGESVKDPHCLAEVSLIYESPIQDFCSGVLVNDQRTILTAAHCLCSGPIEYAIFGSKMQDVKNYRAAVIGQKAHEGIKCPGGGSRKPTRRHRWQAGTSPLFVWRRMSLSMWQGRFRFPNPHWRNSSLRAATKAFWSSVSGSPSLRRVDRCLCKILSRRPWHCQLSSVRTAPAARAERRTKYSMDARRDRKYWSLIPDRLVLALAIAAAVATCWSISRVRPTNWLR